MTSAGPNLRVNVNAPNLGRMLTGGALDGAAACSWRARSGDRYRTGHVVRMPRTRAVSARRPLSRPRPRLAMPASAGDTKPGDEQTRRQLDAQARREWVRRERTRCDGASRLPELDAAALEQESPQHPVHHLHQQRLDQPRGARPSTGNSDGRRCLRTISPKRPNPASAIAQVAGSGTGPARNNPDAESRL